MKNVDEDSGSGSVISQILSVVRDFSGNNEEIEDEDTEDLGGFDLGEIPSLILKTVPADRMLNVQSRLFGELPSDALRDIQNIILTALPMARIVQIIAEEVARE